MCLTNKQARTCREREGASMRAWILIVALATGAPGGAAGRPRAKPGAPAKAAAREPAAAALERGLRLLDAGQIAAAAPAPGLAAPRDPQSDRAQFPLEQALQRQDQTAAAIAAAEAAVRLAPKTADYRLLLGDLQ